MEKTKVKVAQANLGEDSIDIEIVKRWVPEKVSYIGDTVFFGVDGVFFSMKRKDFIEIFRK